MNKIILYPSRDLSRIFSKYSLVLGLCISVSLFFQQTVNAEDGSSLHAENCIACHASMTGGEGSVLYTREDHSVKSLDGLKKQVDRCQSSLGLNWSDEQISSVQQYLNTTFYKF